MKWLEYVVNTGGIGMTKKEQSRRYNYFLDLCEKNIDNAFQLSLEKPDDELPEFKLKKYIKKEVKLKRGRKQTVNKMYMTDEEYDIVKKFIIDLKKDNNKQHLFKLIN